MSAMPPAGLRNTRPPTISDVAKAVGVGRSTAARALGGYGNVKPEVRDAILAAAEAIGYRPNQIAKSMSTGRTRTIGMVLADVSNPFFASVAQGVAVTASTHTFDTVIISTGESVERERAALEVLIDKRVDGVILASSAIERDEIGHIEDLQRAGIAVVLIDRANEFVRADTVVVDNRAITRTAVTSLVEAGHRRIGFVLPPTLAEPVRTRRDLDSFLASGLWTERERLRGYLDALDDAGVPFDAGLILDGTQLDADLTDRYRALLRGESPATAVFCSETAALIRTITAIGDLGLAYPDDVSLIGFDDSPWAAIMRPPLTMVSQPTFEVGTTAAEVLLRRIGGADTGAPRTTTLDAELIGRSSVAPPRSRT